MGTVHIPPPGKAETFLSNVLPLIYSASLRENLNNLDSIWATYVMNLSFGTVNPPNVFLFIAFKVAEELRTAVMIGIDKTFFASTTLMFLEGFDR